MYEEVPKRKRSKWRNFTLKNRDILSIGRLPIQGEFGSTRIAWSITYEQFRDPTTFSEGIISGPTANGISLREAMGKLRLALARHKNPKVEKVVRRMESKGNEFQEMYARYKDYKEQNDEEKII